MSEPNYRQLLSRDEVSRVFWEPFIINGYRRTDTSLWQCIKYMFVLHNDFGNFWTHFIPLWIWLYWLYRLSFHLTDPYWYPLLVVLIGGCLYTFFSSIAHGFGSKSELSHHVCFMMDYLGISMYALGSGIGAYFYERPIGNWLLDHKWCYIVLCAVVCISATLGCSLSGHFCLKQRYLLRAGSFLCPFLLDCLPFVLRMYHCIFILDERCVAETILYHAGGVVASHVMIFFFVSKLPERKSPGKFDYFCHSHQLFHIAAVITTSFHVYVLQGDAIVRRDQLMQDPYYRPDVYCTLAPFVLAFVVGGLAVAVVGLLLHWGCIAPAGNGRTKQKLK